MSIESLNKLYYSPRQDLRVTTLAVLGNLGLLICVYCNT